jgi:nucleotide-binding universal stress UspA family protein
MFQTLLLAIDDSPASAVATDFATAYAKHCGSSVHVLHVNEHQVGGRGLTLLTTTEATELITGAVTQLRDAGVRAGGSVVVASYREVPARIAEIAASRGADAIVLGSRRERHLGRLFSPHVRIRTTRLTPLPVLTAPAPLRIGRRTRRGIDELVKEQLPHDPVRLP